MNETTTANPYKLILTIVAKGKASKVVAASKKAGAKGGTILPGRGTAPVSVYLDILGINFDPEKEIVLILAEEDIIENILQAISNEVKLNQPGNGVAFVVPVKGLAGIIYLLKMLP
jgi:nitrogen regulatory protein P-II 1